jgi:hypothetical protein
MKLARILWVSASFYFLIVLVFYALILDPPDGTRQERLTYIIENYTLYGHQFKAEFLMGTFLCISSLIFAIILRRAIFIMICIGHLIYAFAFPLIIGVYPEASTEISIALGIAANSFVTFGLMFAMAGFFLMHLKLRILPKWLHVLAMIIAAVGFLSYFAAFAGLITNKEAQMSMLFVTFLYFINGMYGLKIREADFK